MKVWLPYTRGGSGSDVFTRMLETGLRERGIDVVSQAFPHNLQYAPWLMRKAPAPAGTDVILANTWNGFAFRRPGAKLVTVEHLFVLDPALRPYRSFAQGVFHNTLVRHFERASMNASDVQVAVSEYTAAAHQHGLGGTKPNVILNGIDTDFFTPAQDSDEPRRARPLRLLFVGNLTRRKGIDLIPGILAALGKGFQLEYAVGLRSADVLSGLQNTRSLGRLNPEEVRAAYRRADLLLFPTRMEGLPLVAMEAMACGTPVVGMNTSSLPEVIEDGRTGRLCTKDDPAAFAAAIRDLDEDDGKLKRMGQAAREAAVQRFNLSRMVDDYVDLLESLCEMRRRGR